MEGHLRKHSPLKDVRFIIAVGSGKGGVGKTTISILLALALSQEGYKVGVFDLDFYGPNAHLLFKDATLSPFKDTEGFKPAEYRGLKLMSLSFLVSEREPMFMRGPLAGKLLKELTLRVIWGPLDFLILDLPPGTGDIFLEMLQVFDPDGFLMVTTCHKLSLADSRRVLTILKAEEIPILGVVENMFGLFQDREVFTQFLKDNNLHLIFSFPFSQDIAQAESVEVFLEDEAYGALLKDFVSSFLKRVFRIH